MAFMLATTRQLTVRPVSERDLQGLANLIHFEAHVHRHLDWRAPLDWVGYHPYLVGEHNGEIMAALACPPDPPLVAWIRLFATSSEMSVKLAWEELWSVAHDQLCQLDDIALVAAIPLQRWFRNLLEKSNFVHTHNVIVLSWKRTPIPSLAITHPGVIRTMELRDINAVEDLDRAAFGLIWQISTSGLEVAFRQAALASVVEIDGKIIGYQISTATPMGGHLARLAVLPQYQGQGIGYALLHDLLVQFERRGAQSVTVNTQNDNLSSLALYRKAGFKRTGEEYPICQFQTS